MKVQINGVDLTDAQCHVLRLALAALDTDLTEQSGSMFVRMSDLESLKDNLRGIMALVQRLPGRLSAMT